MFVNNVVIIMVLNIIKYNLFPNNYLFVFINIGIHN